MFKHNPLLSWLFCLGVAACADAEQLVPPTAERDPRLPQVEVVIAGRARKLHLETFGAPANPVLLVFHGAEGSDYRALLPLKALADRYFVVMWDGRGSGLSERILPAEISEQSYADEMHLVKQLFSPDKPASLIAYSSGGFHAAIAAKYYLDDFSQIVLVESDPLDAATRKKVNNIEIPVTAEWVNSYLWQNEFVTPDDHDSADFKLMSATQPALAPISCDPKRPSHYPLWRLGAMVRAEVSRVFAQADYRQVWAEHPNPVLIIATHCGPLNADFQREQIAPLFRQAQIVELGEGVDHLSLFEAGQVAVLSALREFLSAYQEEL